MKTDRNELRWVLVWALVIIVLASLPYLYGKSITPPGYLFAGFTQNIDDAAVYLSWARQAADGHLFIRNLFTNEPQAGRQVNLLFLAMGTAARVTHLPGSVVYHLFRAALGVGLFVAIWQFAGLFLSERRQRLVLIPLVGLSSGIGWLIPNVQAPVGSVDVWQPEAITFLSIYLNPLFLAGLMLMLGALYYLVITERTGRVRYALLAGVHVLLLANVHTYDVLTVAVVWLAYVVVHAALERKFPARTVTLSLLAAAISLPSLAYQVYNYRIDPVFQARANDVIASPPVTSFLTGYGFVLIGAVCGFVLALAQSRRHKVDAECRVRHWFLLPAVWSVVGFAIPYIPIAQQRKLIMGVHIPLCILAAVSIAYLMKRLRPIYAYAVLTALLAVVFQSNSRFLQLDTQLLGEGRTVTRYSAFLSIDQIKAMEYVRAHSSPSQCILSGPQISLFLPAYAGRQVYCGHWSETPDYDEKLNEWIALLSPNVPLPEKNALMARINCDFVVVDSRNPEEQHLPVKALSLVKVAEFGAIIVYEVPK